MTKTLPILVVEDDPDLREALSDTLTLSRYRVLTAMDGAHALATGGNFYELRKWSDSDWKQAREMIEAQNAKDKAQR